MKLVWPVNPSIGPLINFQLNNSKEHFEQVQICNAHKRSPSSQEGPQQLNYFYIAKKSDLTKKGKLITIIGKLCATIRARWWVGGKHDVSQAAAAAGKWLVTVLLTDWFEPLWVGRYSTREEVSKDGQKEKKNFPRKTSFLRDRKFTPSATASAIESICLMEEMFKDWWMLKW